MLNTIKHKTNVKSRFLSGKKQFYIFLFLFSFGLQAQTNLVPNPSFEDTLACPITSDEIYDAIGWSSPTSGTPDYFNSCHTSPNDAGVPDNFFGNQMPFQGNAYAGFCLYQTPNSREYIQVKLDSVMEGGIDYCVSYYVSLEEVSGYAIKQIGMYFSSTSISNPIMTVLPFTPQVENNFFISDTILWVKVTGMFKAIGGEQYLVMGNFKDDSNTDTSKVSNNSNASCYYIDSVTVQRCTPLSIKKDYLNRITIYPNPVNDSFVIDVAENVDYCYKLFDIAGRELLATKSRGKTKVDVSYLPKGIYILNIKTENGSFNYKIVVQH